MRVWATQAWPLFISANGMRVGERGVEVGIVGDDGGRLAAELERAPLELLAADGTDLATGGRATGEPDLVDVGMAHEVLADLTTGRDDVDDAGGQPDLLEDLGHQQRVERGLGGGLQHHGRAADAKAGPSFRATMNRGTFQGMMPAATPTGSRRTMTEPIMPERLSSKAKSRTIAGVVVEHRGRGEHLAHLRERERGAVLVGDEGGELVHARRDGGRELAM